MRPSTKIHIALRNIGDAADPGEIFHGTLSECILWQARKLANISIANRIVIGMGRNEADARKAIDVMNTSKAHMTPDMVAMLSSLWEEGASGEASDDTEAPENSTESCSRLHDINLKQTEKDDYVP